MLTSLLDLLIRFMCLVGLKEIKNVYNYKRT